MTSVTFQDTGLSPVLLTALKAAGFNTPTPIQQLAIPIALTGADLVGIAQTGTGKTLAFGLPIIEKLTAVDGRALILVPTRELALQVEEAIRQVAAMARTRISSLVLIGGAPMRPQVEGLRRNPRIIIATPGRLQDHITQRTVSLASVNTLVLDEADRMLDMGFHRQIIRILESVPKERQTMLFSATMSPEITKLSEQYLHSPQRVEAARQGTSPEQIEQEICYVTPDRKPEVLELLLLKHQGPVLVFSRTKHGAAKLTRHLGKIGHIAAELHSNKSLNQRRTALDGFKAGKFRVLVATDIAARGIDVSNIELVINYDLPDVAEDYVHRIGRTGRAGKSGIAVSFASHDQLKDVAIIERLMNKDLPLSEYSDAKRNMRPSTAAPGGRGRNGQVVARVDRPMRSSFNNGGGNGGRNGGGDGGGQYAQRRRGPGNGQSSNRSRGTRGMVQFGV
ncbi:MAG TPA: DEAD/DEAH box helicase [Capsulimonadaceae bacterium]|jgi:ATP-dependent RNA helicase RhlE